MQITYGGVTITLEGKCEVRREAIYSEDGTTLIGMRFVVEVQASE